MSFIGLETTAHPLYRADKYSFFWKPDPAKSFLMVWSFPYFIRIKVCFEDVIIQMIRTKLVSYSDLHDAGLLLSLSSFKCRYIPIFEMVIRLFWSIGPYVLFQNSSVKGSEKKNPLWSLTVNGSS